MSSTPPSPGSEKAPGKNANANTPQKQRATLLALILGAILLAVLYCRHMVAGLTSPDAMDFAQAARNLLQGHGFTTQILHPIALTSHSDPLHQPDTDHGILYPLCLAIAFGMFGAKDGVVIAVSCLFYVLTVPVLFLLGKRLFDIRVGSIAALIFLTNSSILEYAASGTHITLFLFLATCLFYTLHVLATAAATDSLPVPPLPKLLYLLAGVLMGLLYLADPLFLWITPVLLVALARMNPKRPVLALAWFGIPLLVLLLPAMVRFGQLTGNPFFGLRGAELWMGTEQHPGLVGYRIPGEQFYSERGAGNSLLRKLCLALVEAVAFLPRMPGSWILLFVAPSLVYQYSNASATRLRSMLLWSLLALLGGGLFFLPYPIRLMAVFPGLLVYAVAFLRHTLVAARLKKERIGAACTLLGLLLLAPLGGDLIKTRYPATTSEVGAARSASKQIPAGEICFSDQPWLMAWYGERASIWIPRDDLTLWEFRHQFVGARWLFLTRQTPPLSPEWDETYRGMLGWTQQYHRASVAHGGLPAPLKISGSSIPLLKALDGFETVPPTGEAMPTVVIAVAPAASK